MKKGIWIFLFLVIAGFVVFLIGIFRNEDKKDSDLMHTSSMTDASVTDEVDLEEEEQYLEEVKEDKDKIEKEGNVFPVGSYQVYGGFGYKVEEFHIFESYSDFEQSEYYNPDYVGYVSMAAEQSTFAYVKVRVTNEDRYEKEFLPNDCLVVCAENGSREAEGYECLPSDCSYSSKVKNWQNIEDEKAWDHFKLQVGGSVSVEMGTTIAYQKNGSDEIVGTDEVFSNPKYYLQIQGSGPLAGGREMELEKAVSYIYIELE